MTTVNMLEAKTSLSKLVEAVESGAENEIIIARNGKPAIVPLATEPRKKRQLGLLAGKYPPMDFEAFQAMDAEIEAMFLGEARGEVRLLLDTHIAIWTLTEPRRIPANITDLPDPVNTVAVSAIVVLEIAIKHQLGRRDSPPFSGHEAIAHFEHAGFVMLDVTPAHAAVSSACLHTF